MNKVYIPIYDAMTARMFKENGFDVVDNIKKASILCFTGGADVTPSIYGHQVHPTTSYDTIRDEYETEYYHEAKNLGIPMAGICRGGQFLNVMNGGAMYQNVTGHCNGNHMAEIDGDILLVSSTHHQMMFPAIHGDVIGIGHGTVSNKTFWSKSLGRFVDSQPGLMDDVEVVVYDNVLCFQPHPEFAVGSQSLIPCMKKFFNLIEKYCVQAPVAA